MRSSVLAVFFSLRTSLHQLQSAAIASAFVKCGFRYKKNTIGQRRDNSNHSLTNRNEPVPWRILGYMRPHRQGNGNGNKELWTETTTDETSILK